MATPTRRNTTSEYWIALQALVTHLLEQDERRRCERFQRLT